MSYDKKSVDALLATACSRLLNAGSLLNKMRLLHDQDREQEYWQTADSMGEHLEIGAKAIIEVNRTLFKARGINPQAGNDWMN